MKVKNPSTEQKTMSKEKFECRLEELACEDPRSTTAAFVYEDLVTDFEPTYSSTAWQERAVFETSDKKEVVRVTVHLGEDVGQKRGVVFYRATDAWPAEWESEFKQQFGFEMKMGWRLAAEATVDPQVEAGLIDWFRLKLDHSWAHGQSQLSPDTRELRRLQSVKTRGRRFRRLLTQAYGSKCAVTGCQINAVLEGAHIEPHIGFESDVVSNGMLLRVDIHRLYDAGLIDFDADNGFQLQLSSTLAGTHYEELDGVLLSLPAEESWRPAPGRFQRRRERLNMKA